MKKEKIIMNKNKGKIPEPTIERLALYFRYLNEMKNKGMTIVSSEDIASRTGVKASQFRKDISYFGEFGITGLGYPIHQLLDKIADIMHLNRRHNVAIIGLGNLGTAFAQYKGFSKWGFHISHIFDKNPDKIGLVYGNTVVEDIKTLPRNLETVSMAMLTVPASAAEKTAGLMLDSQVKAILNFTGVNLSLPESITVRNVDVTNEMVVLMYFKLSGGVEV